MPDYVDQLGTLVHLDAAPQRIVSLVPSQTELLFDLGLADRVVGVTSFCTEPAIAVEQNVKIGGTKRFLFDRIDALRPDLIVANKEENYREGIDRLREDRVRW